MQKHLNGSRHIFHYIRTKLPLILIIVASIVIGMQLGQLWTTDQSTQSSSMQPSEQSPSTQPTNYDQRTNTLGEVITTDSSLLQFINYTNFSTDMILDYLNLAEAQMASRQSSVFAFIYPVGKFIKEGGDFNGLPFNTHEVVLSEEQIDEILAEIEYFLREDECMGDNRERIDDHLYDYAQWLKGGADASTMQALCPRTRIVAMGVPPDMQRNVLIDYLDKEFKKEQSNQYNFAGFLFHEFYHAFQQDLETEGECRQRADQDGSTSRWMIEGGAEYFAQMMLQETGYTEDYSSNVLRNAQNALNEADGSFEEAFSRMPDKVGQGILRLLVERGTMNDAFILDASYFHDCKREFEFSKDNSDIIFALNNWYKIIERDGKYEFADEVLENRPQSQQISPDQSNKKESILDKIKSIPNTVQTKVAGPIEVLTGLNIGVKEFAHCTSDEQKMCWTWPSDAPAECVAADKAGISIGRGATTEILQKYEYCWEERTYREFVSIAPSKTIAIKPTAEQLKNAEELMNKGWKNPVNTPVTYYVTKDLDSSVLDYIKPGMDASQEYLGTYGPLRVYVIGSDVEEAKLAAVDFCTWSYPKDRIDHCVQDQGIGIEEIAFYEGTNGFAQHSRDMVRQAFVIGNPHQGGGNKVATHEYIHIYQNAHILIQGNNSDDLKWPIWFEEGGAEFLALYLWSKNDPDDINFENSMREALETSKRLSKKVPGISLADVATNKLRDRTFNYCGNCIGSIQYEFGIWATAYLANLTSIDTVYKEYIPRAHYLGWTTAFEEIFGLSVDQFYQDFADFLLLDTAEQMNILPE